MCTVVCPFYTWHSACPFALLQRHSEYLVYGGPFTKHFCFSRLLFTLDLGMFSHSVDQYLVPYLPSPLSEDHNPIPATSQEMPSHLGFAHERQGKMSSHRQSKKKAESVFTKYFHVLDTDIFIFPQIHFLFLFCDWLEYKM